MTMILMRFMVFISYNNPILQLCKYPASALIFRFEKSYFGILSALCFEKILKMRNFAAGLE